MKLRLVVIDDHPLVRQGISSILRTESSMEVVGEAENFKDAVNVIKSTEPDLSLIDLRLGNDSGLSVIEQAKQLGIKGKFAILTSSGNEQDFLYAEQLGVSGYILKEALPEEIIHAIKVISRGRKYYDPGILELKMRGETLMSEGLTPREKEVLIALGNGLNNQDIAASLFVSENTVKKHVSQVLAKLNLADRTQAALYAYSKGLVEPQMY